MDEVIVGIDCGLKRIGLAKKVGELILPIEPIIRKNRNQAAFELESRLKQLGANKIAVGIPDTNFVDSSLEARLESKKRILHFINLVNFSGEIIYINEDNTSLEALDHLKHLPKKKRQIAQKNGLIDSLAACEILKRI